MSVQTPAVAIATERFVRSDIQALRAIAVVLVVLDHLVVLQHLPGSPEGGFIGVDVFFVISGFLITQHLVSEEIGKHRISFRDFYIRRARRILPMAILVILVTIAASFAVFWPQRAANFSIDGLWSALFVSNVAFALRGVDYFAQEQTSIFQHYWSLSVEEQFYLAWPLVIALGGYVALRRRQPRTVFLTITLVVAVVSFVWACVATAISPTTAYFSTFARAFEFAIGGSLAVVAPTLGRIPGRARRWISLCGLLAIAASVWIIDPDWGFPGPMALMPTLGTALVIAAGTGTKSQVMVWPLNTRPVGYVGDISYSLYLWHWPLIMFIGAFVPRNVVLVPAALVLSFGLATLSYRCVERPVLSSAWLLRGRHTEPAIRRETLKCFAFMAVGILVAAVSIGAGDVAVRAVDASRTDTTNGGDLSIQTQPPAALHFVEDIQKMIKDSRGRPDWAGLVPDVSRVQPYTGEIVDNCWNRPGEKPRMCLRGDPAAAKTIAVLGDSIALNTSFSVDEFVRQHPDWNMAVYAKLGCGAPRVPTFAPDGSDYVDCDTFRDWAIQRINEEKPDAVLIVSAVPRKLRGVSEDNVFSVWADGLGDTLDRLSSVPNIYVLTPPPEGRDLAFCSRPFNVPDDCSTVVNKRWIENRDALLNVSQAHGRTFIDTGMWFCDTQGYCPAVIGRFIPRRDERHLTFDYAKFLGPLLGDWFLAPAKTY